MTELGISADQTTTTTCLVLRPFAGQAADEELVGRVNDDRLDDVERRQVHGGVGAGGTQHHRHVGIIIVGAPDLQAGTLVSVRKSRHFTTALLCASSATRT